MKSKAPQSTVSQFDPKALPDIDVTEAASIHLRGMLNTQKAQAVRLGITESGCNGYMYELDYATEIATDHERYNFAEGLVVIVRRADLPLIRGTRIDYVTEGLNSSLKFYNPNADTHCGCGESFSVSA